jgi:hypothetical protein
VFAPPAVPTFWDRYRAAPAPVPPETPATALWLVYREALNRRAEAALTLASVVAAVGRAAVTDLPDLSGLFNLRGAAEAAWRHSPDGRAARAVPLLAVRTARRATRANPADYEGYLRLAAAYGAFATDPALGQLQQVTAARQALIRLPIAAAYNQFTAPDEQALQAILYQNYSAMVDDPQAQFHPRDLALESLERLVELFRPVAGFQAGGRLTEDQTKQLEAEYKRLQQGLEQLRQDVRRRSDSYENAAGKYPPPARAAIALQFGLAREALNVLRNAEPAEMNPPAIELMLHLLLLAGEADSARELLQSQALNPVTQLPFDMQLRIHALHVRTAAALGDYANGIEHSADMLRMFPRVLQGVAGPSLAAAVGLLVQPDSSPAYPLTRVTTFPSWGGGLLSITGMVQQNADDLVQQGMLLLEQGEPAKAKDRLNRAVNPPVGPRVNFRTRPLAQHWLELFGG